MCVSLTGSWDLAVLVLWYHSACTTLLENVAIMAPEFIRIQNMDRQLFSIVQADTSMLWGLNHSYRTYL